jgi:hypothetical protein
MYGNQDDEFATDFYPGPDTTYFFNSSLLKTKRQNSESFTNYTNCVFNRDPKFINNQYNFHLDTLSPAIGIGNPFYSVGPLQYDLHGVSRENAPDAGADQYVYTPSEE